MNDVSIEGTDLVVDQTGLDKLWGLQGRLRIPLAHVRGATADPGAATEPRGVRAPGLHVPGRSVGTFHRDGEATYWNVDASRENVVIALDGERFARLVLTVTDAAEVERLVNAAIDA